MKDAYCTTSNNKIVTVASKRQWLTGTRSTTFGLHDFISGLLHKGTIRCAGKLLPSVYFFLDMASQPCAEKYLSSFQNALVNLSTQEIKEIPIYIIM